MRSRDPGDPGIQFAAAFPRPGPALKGILATIAVFAIAGAIFMNWGPKAVGVAMFDWLALDPSHVLTRPWTIFTSGVLTSFDTYRHAFWSLLGLYFLTPDLEKRWGAWRLVRFVALSIAFGNLAVLAAALNPVAPQPPYLGIAFGPTAAITATAIAWAREHKNAQIRFLFFLPMSGKTLLWLTLGLAALYVVFMEKTPEGAFAPVGGAAAGLLLAGSPSPVRAVWLRVRLFFLRRRGARLDVASLTGDLEDRPRPKRAKGGPALRVVPGGLEDELKNRKPPKDKRYLN